MHMPPCAWEGRRSRQDRGDAVGFGDADPSGMLLAPSLEAAAAAWLRTSTKPRGDARQQSVELTQPYWV